MAAQGANAEISAYNPASGYLYTVGGGSGAIVVSDLRNPVAAKIVAKAIPSVSGQTLQSVADSAMTSSMCWKEQAPITSMAVPVLTSSGW